MKLQVRNYRYVVGAFAIVTMFMLLRSSDNLSDSVSSLQDFQYNIQDTIQYGLQQSGLLPESDGSAESNEKSLSPGQVPGSAQNNDGAAAQNEAPLNDASQVNSQPVSPKPGVIDDSTTDNNNPDVSNAVKENLKAQDKATSKPCDKENKFVIIIDAGSSGSRMHLYKFDVCTSPATLIKEYFLGVSPGLSAFPDNAIEAANSLEPLLKRALEVIPEAQRACTPITVKATAGLRLTGDEVATEILAAVRNLLETKYPFPIIETNGIEIMSGTDEGINAWISTNYLLGNIGTSKKVGTSAVFDLGGGSTQIVFEPSYPKRGKLPNGVHRFDLPFSGIYYTLYQYSHLGYGLSEARKKISVKLMEQYKLGGIVTEADVGRNLELNHPCIPSKMQFLNQKVKVSSGEIYTVDFLGSTDSNPERCRNLITSVFDKSSCSTKPCSFDGVHQPSLEMNFPEIDDLYIISFFFDRTYNLGLPKSFTLREMKEFADTICGGPETYHDSFAGVPSIIGKARASSLNCLDLQYEVALLETGYGIPLDRELRTAQKISGSEVTWCLGAALPLLEEKNGNAKLQQTQPHHHRNNNQ
ncbi:hypothetical protein TPHA_0F03360 [Tetrapisispora phaffii CBS 4417]|uniref:guanosine-diphosphatase n=1 Tax=Tetrapisispora phaffii (strain ATCC 24235 / CBS 4417 / NBRC 1672 / NRRL Y-8282 / UCD 70-5) TaxID=1071381 RepID=G8BUN1_TETPH|nr:hypothetical protein TPHA_0F03360 [Tetrapisispora phaffii CBS 4417]CCE63817.1 hypothetical protein TPHA_0F03360 [Tetrapisispora phaffii CBS 4417]